MSGAPDLQRSAALFKEINRAPDSVRCAPDCPVRPTTEGRHCADEAGREGDSHGVHVVDGLACVQQSLFDGGTDELTVAAAGDMMS